MIYGERNSRLGIDKWASVHRVCWESKEQSCSLIPYINLPEFVLRLPTLLESWWSNLMLMWAHLPILWPLSWPWLLTLTLVLKLDSTLLWSTLWSTSCWQTCTGSLYRAQIRIDLAQCNCVLCNTLDTKGGSQHLLAKVRMRQAGLVYFRIKFKGPKITKMFEQSG